MCAIYVTPAAAVEWSGVEELVLEGLLRGEPVRRQRLQQPPAQRERAVREPRHAAARGHRGGLPGRGVLVIVVLYVIKPIIENFE